MATSTTLNFIEECRISPPPGSVPPTSLPLTILDAIWLLQPHTVQRLLFYEFHYPRTYFLEKILPNIKSSLSLTLQHFFPLAGNLAWPQGSSIPEIQYVDGDFLLLTVAESDNGNFSTLRENQPKDVSFLYPLAPKLLDRSNDKLLPLMAVQVTLFPNQGICIGITYNHLVADGRAIHHFIKTWASICKHHGLDNESLLPWHDKSMLIKKSSDTFIANYLKKCKITSDTFHLHLTKDGSNLNLVVSPLDEKVLATFVMRPPSIKRLRQWVQSQTANEKLHLSTFVLTCAYVWVCLLKARWGEEVAEEESKEEFEYVGTMADCRSLLDPPLPSTFFGNSLTGFFIMAKRSDLTRKDGMLIAAKLIGNAIQKIQKGDAILRGFESYLSSDSINFNLDRVFSVAGSPKFGIYETDFGWGNPKKSEVISIVGTGAVSLTECPTEVGGVEVGLVRKVSEMNAFSSLFANDLPC